MTDELPIVAAWVPPPRLTLTVYLPGVSCDHPDAATGDQPVNHPHRWIERADRVDDFYRRYPELRDWTPEPRRVRPPRA